MSWQQDLFATCFPGWAARREENRARYETMKYLRTYAAAEKNRLTADWNPGTQSPDTALIDDQETLRNRSRQLNRDDPHAAAATGTRVAHVVGERVRVTPKAAADIDPIPAALKGIKLLESQVAIANSQAEWAWSMIADNIDGHGMSFTEYLQLEDRQVAESGESLTRFVAVKRENTELSVAVELIEADRLMTPMDKTGNKQIRNGIEFGDDGHPVAYWIARGHPGDTTILIRSDDFDRFPAATIIHNFDILRPGQSRGMPWLTPVMRYLRDKGKWMEAELVAQRLSACLALLIKTTNPSSVVTQQGALQSSGERHETIKAGQFHYLRPNEDVTQLNPLRPGEHFVPSIHEILRAVGTALHIPYVVLAQDFENVNYSSMRAAIVQMERFTAMRREHKRNRVIRRIWDMFYTEAVMAGMITALNYRLRKLDYQRFRVQWPASRWVDPEKEVKADVIAVEELRIPRDDILAKYGMTAAEADAAEVEDNARRKLLGLKPIARGKQSPGQSPGAPPASEDDGTSRISKLLRNRCGPINGKTRTINDALGAELDDA